MNVVDWTEFWAENERCLAAGLSLDKPRCAVTLPVDDHWLIDEMSVPSTVRYYTDDAYRADVNRQANDRCEAAFGRRPFDESIAHFPPPRRVEELLGSRYEVVEGGTPWLEPGFAEPAELAAHLDRVEDWSDDELDARLFDERRGVVPDPGEHVRWSRGPTTILTSAIGAEPLIWWCLDEPELMERAFRVAGELVVRIAQREAVRRGGTVRGLAWLDDHCALLNPEMYRRFALPAMKAAFAALAPDPGDFRFQHSDSDMAHLLPCLAEYGLHGVNLGPKIPAATIRAALPQAIVHGQMPPFRLRNDPWDVVRDQIQRDVDEAAGDGALVITTAGSIPAGTTLERIRDFTLAAAEIGRYRPA